MVGRRPRGDRVRPTRELAVGWASVRDRRQSAALAKMLGYAWVVCNHELDGP
jgi:hypothetical protein